MRLSGVGIFVRLTRFPDASGAWSGHRQQTCLALTAERLELRSRLYG